MNEQLERMIHDLIEKLEYMKNVDILFSINGALFTVHGVYKAKYILRTLKLYNVNREICSIDIDNINIKYMFYVIC